MQLKPGTELQNGRYRIIRTLGQGGFGITYEAEQVALHRKVAIKEFFMKEYCERDGSTSHVTLGATEGSKNLVARFRDKFFKEALMIAGLDHPNIVKIHDVFEENGTAYYSMEYIIGGSLKELIARQGKLSEKQALKYMTEVGEALQYVHDKKILHFDIKPSNIMLRESGTAALIDFGISKHFDEGGRVTSSTPVGISKGYAPLEQYRQEEISIFKPSTDIYALGATLYNLVTGSIPPEAATVNEDGLDRPKGISDRIWNAIEQAMQPRQKDRPQTVEAFLALLDAEETPKIAVTSATPIFSEETVITAKEEQKPKDLEPKTPKSVAIPEKKKSKTGLWVLMGGIAAAAIIVAIVLRTPTVGMSELVPTGSLFGHDYVDLGLSVKWATCNVDATKPGDYGSYFAWGETKPKSEYTWGNYQFRTSGNSEDDVTFSKYNTPNYLDIVDNMKLDLADDAARANWGGKWRMPTNEEMKELREKCSWTWMRLGGKKGYKVTGKNGNSIFLPAAGHREESRRDVAGSEGYYWSSSLDTEDPSHAKYVRFESDGVYGPIFNR